jgi:carbamoyl-phosphate synthase large subunit
MKIFITSVGSLVGKNILDVLEWPGLSRRSLVEVIGANSVANAPTNFRCDRCYLVPETGDPHYADRMVEILFEERADLILCGRDSDTYALSELRARHPELPGVLPVGTPQSALIGLDKWQTYSFCSRHDLPRAETFNLAISRDEAALDAFCRKAGYPLIAKPVHGFAARGVFLLRNAGDVRSFVSRDGYLLQEYVGDREALRSYFASLDGPLPLFMQAPNTGHYSGQTVIAPNGDLSPPFVSFNPLEFGSSRVITRVNDPSLDELTLAFGRALAAEGARGPMNAAFRRAPGGAWKLQELNLRATGTTVGRFLMGMDELYLIVRDYVPGAEFPHMQPAEHDHSDRVGRHDATYVVPDRYAAALRDDGKWSSDRGSSLR